MGKKKKYGKNIVGFWIFQCEEYMHIQERLLIEQFEYS